MFQPRAIQLTGRDRSRGERLAMSATGGVYFDSSPAGIYVSFDDSSLQLPVKSGRSYDAKFTSLTFWHAPGYEGELTAILYEKGEGVFDNAGAGGSSGSATESSVLVDCVSSIQFPSAGTRTMHIYRNPIGSGRIYVLEEAVFTQNTVGTAVSDSIDFGSESGASGMGQANMNYTELVAPGGGAWYSDASRAALKPPLLVGLAQPTGGAIPVTLKTLNYNRALTGGDLWERFIHGIILRPGFWFAMRSLPTSSSTTARARWRESTTTV